MAAAAQAAAAQAAATKTTTNNGITDVYCSPGYDVRYESVGSCKLRAKAETDVHH